MAGRDRGELQELLVRRDPRELSEPMDQQASQDLQDLMVLPETEDRQVCQDLMDRQE